MNTTIRFFSLTGIAVLIAIGSMYATGAPPESMEKRDVTLSGPETEAVKKFELQLAEYQKLRDQLEDNLDPLGEEATPEEIDEHRAQLRAAIKTARVGAKPGDFFTPGMESLVKRICRQAATGSNGKEVQSTIMDENPGKLPQVGVNDRYPDGVPVATMPAELLDALPKLNPYMEYRFLGKRLVLVDAGAGMVLDVTPEVMP